MLKVIKEVDILEEIKCKKSGTYKIALEDKEKLRNKLQELRRNNIFQKYNMSYVYTETKDNILLILHDDSIFI